MRVFVIIEWVPSAYTGATSHREFPGPSALKVVYGARERTVMGTVCVEFELRACGVYG